MFDKEPSWWQLALGYVVLGIYCLLMCLIGVAGWVLGLPARVFNWVSERVFS